MAQRRQRIFRLGLDPPSLWLLARSFDDLSDDLESGRLRLARCLADELALRLRLQDAADAVEDGWLGDEELGHLPEHADDFAWEALLDVLVKDHDAGQLVPGQGTAPGPDANGHGGDLSLLWFATFAEAEPRDESRPFRV